MSCHRATRPDRRTTAQAARLPVTITYADLFALVASLAVVAAYYGLFRYTA